MPPLTSGSVGVMVEKRRYRSDRYRLIPVSAVYTRGERLHKIRDRPAYANITVRNAMLDAVRAAYPDGSAVSLDTLHCTAIPYECVSYIPDPFSLSPEQILLRKESMQELHSAMENIPLRENVWIRYRFGFDDAPQAFCTAAAYFHLTRGRAKRVERLALGHLRENLIGRKHRVCLKSVQSIAKSHRCSDSHAIPLSRPSTREGSKTKKMPIPAVRQTSTASA